MAGTKHLVRMCPQCRLKFVKDPNWPHVCPDDLATRIGALEKVAHAPGPVVRVDVVADLERRIIALEDAHDVLQTDLANAVARADRLGAELRASTGLLVDLAAPARRVVAFVDNPEDPRSPRVSSTNCAHPDPATLDMISCVHCGVFKVTGVPHKLAETLRIAREALATYGGAERLTVTIERK